MIIKGSIVTSKLLAEFLLFLFITILFQVLWEFFEEQILSFPPLKSANQSIGNALLFLAPAILNPIFSLNIIQEGNNLVLPDGFTITYQDAFSGIKQMLLASTLFILIPGPWIKKIWFIPLTIFLILLMVLLRFVVVALHCTIYPEHLHLLQDMLWGPLFYFEILTMWVVWLFFITRKCS